MGLSKWETFNYCTLIRLGFPLFVEYFFWRDIFNPVPCGKMMVNYPLCIFMGLITLTLFRYF